MAYSDMEVVEELTDEILNPLPIEDPGNPEDLYGSICRCVTLDTITPFYTDDDVNKYIRFMDEHQYKYNTDDEGRICLSDFEHHEYENDPEDPRYKFCLYLYFYRRFPNEVWKRACIGYIHPYAIRNEDGTYDIDLDYSLECSIEEFQRLPGDYFKITLPNTDLDVQECKLDYIETEEDFLHRLNFE